MDKEQNSVTEEKEASIQQETRFNENIIVTTEVQKDVEPVVNDTLKSNQDSIYGDTDNCKSTEEIVEPTIKLLELSSNRKWHAQFEAIVGLNHRKNNPPLPCQDSVISLAEEKAFVISADGAGSSAVSDIGSYYVARGIARFYQTINLYISSLLDTEQVDEKACHNFALLTVKHARGILQDLSTEHRRPLKDFRCTLLLALCGKVSTLWLKIGDGAIVVESISEIDGIKTPKLRTLGEVGKGEFANYTTFVDEKLEVDDVQIGIEPSKNISALFCMSDGAAEKLVSNDGQCVAKRLSQWAEQLRTGKLHRHHLTMAFYDKDFQKRHTGDDCSIAIIASEIK